MSDVVAKLDAWLKSHNQGAYEDRVVDSICDLIGVREELEGLANPLPAHTHDSLCNFGNGCLSSTTLLELVRALNTVCEQLNLALNAMERAS